MKVCIKCGCALTPDNTVAYRTGNYIHKCNECMRTEKREYASTIPKEIVLDRSRRCRANTRTLRPKTYTAQQQYSSSRKRAIKYNLEHNISSAYIESISPDRCPVFDEPLKYGGGRKTHYSASLDRIDPKKGYVEGNVQVISTLANTMKSDAPSEQLLKFASWVINTKKTST